MRELWKHVCSPRHLMVFEAVARSGSFTRAADELNVQQPAVSATIRQLEERMGIDLFVRGHRKIELTVAGERLFADTSRAFDDLSRSAMAVRQLSRGDYVTLNASAAFNTYWLMPRLSALKAVHPGVDLRVQSSDREPDLSAENISMAIRLGEGEWVGCESALIAHEVIYPVAAPLLMAEAQLEEARQLLKHRLIHLEEPVRKRVSWNEWLCHFDIKEPAAENGLRLNEYTLVLHAAMTGAGFAIGWHHLVAGLVSQGLLAARTDWRWITGRGYYVVWSRSHPLSADAIAIRDWIVSQPTPMDFSA